MIFVTTLVFGIFWHFVLRKFWWANLGSTISATCLTLIFASSSHYNFRSPDIFREVAEIMVISYALSMLIGAVFLKIRNAKIQQES